MGLQWVYKTSEMMLINDNFDPQLELKHFIEAGSK